MDGCICQLRPRYARALAEYKRLYQHKTRILKDGEQHPSLLDALDDFSLRMAQCGAVIVHYRAHSPPPAVFSPTPLERSLRRVPRCRSASSTIFLPRLVSSAFTKALSGQAGRAAGGGKGQRGDLHHAGQKAAPR